MSHNVLPMAVSGSGLSSPHSSPSMDDDPPFESFSCPITGALMEDPVMTIGTYALQSGQHGRAPLCALALTPSSPTTHPTHPTGDGHTYERYAIEEWFRRNHRTSPLTGAPLLNLTLVSNITLRNAIEEYRASIDKLQSPGRITSPGEEKRRALAFALDAREVRMGEIRRGVDDAKATEGEMGVIESEENREDIGYWLRTRTMLSHDAVTEYMALLAKEGATSMSFLRDADYSRRELIDLGVRVPHVASLHRIVDEFCGRETGTNGGSGTTGRDEGPVTPDLAGATALASALRTVVSNAAVDRNHPLVNALNRCGLRLNMDNGPVTTFMLLVKALKSVQGSAAVATAGLEVMRTLGRDEAHRKAFGEVGACEVVVPNMTAFPQEASVAAEGCWAIRNLAIDDSLAAILAAYEACQAVVTAMSNFPQHKSTQEQAAAAIVNLGGNNRELKRALSSAGATRAIMESMRRWPADPDVLKQCCWAILTLAVDDEIARRLFSEGACEAVVAAMRACPTDRLVLTKACAAIVNLSGGNQTIKTSFGTMGACDEVIRAMRAFPRDGPLQKQVCWAMKNLAGANDPNRKRFAPGLDGVVLAVRNFGTDRDVAEQALGALRTLAVDDENARSFGELGACDVVTTAMRAHPNVAGIQVQSCGSIINLCGNNPDNRKRLADSGACELVAAALRNHRTDRGVNEQACWAVTSLGVSTPDNRRKLGEAGVCQCIVATLRTFHTDRPVVEQAVSAVRNLAIEEENTRKLGSEGACEAIVMVMRTYPAEAAFQSKACAAVVNLAGGNSDNKRKLGLGGAVEAVVAALKAFPNDASVTEQGLWATKNMAVDAENTVLFGNVGICEVITAALRTFQQDPRVLIQALAAAVNCSGGNDDNKKRLGTLGACEEIVKAMQAFPKNPTVQLQACWCIKNISNNSDDNKRKFGPTAGELVVLALRTYPTDEGILREGRAALRNLSNNNPENRARIEALDYKEHYVRAAPASK